MNMHVDLATLRPEINIIIHAAASINLRSSISKIKDVIIGASAKLAKFALECEHLERFVYVSTAYVNGFVYQRSDAVDVDIAERIYTFTGDTTMAEWEEIQNNHEPVQFKEFIDQFPFPYTYAKHLTERVLHHTLGENLLILRPSIIGPAQRVPFEGFHVPLSTPFTVAAASLMITPSLSITFSTRSATPETETTCDEVPVDVVVDRLLAHISRGTTGVVHAVSGKRARIKSGDMIQGMMNERRIPWIPKNRWKHIHWHSPKLHQITRLYVIFGTSFNFSEEKTYHLWESLSETEKFNLELFADDPASRCDFSKRKEHTRYAMERISNHNIRARLLVRLFYRD